MRGYFLCLVLCCIHTVHSQGDSQKTYLSEVTSVCAGAEYEVGCGIADGTKVMNLSQLYIVLDIQDGAFQCAKNGICHLYMGGENDDGLTAQPLLNLYKSIEHNCQGKPMCTGRLPPYSDVEVYLPMGSYAHQCGWDTPEYLSFLNIATRCIDAGTIEELPPYEYEKPIEETTATTTPTTTTINGTTTIPPTTTTTTEPTTKAVEKTTGSSDDKGNTGKPTGEKKTDLWIVLVVVGVVVGVAVVVGLVITIWVLCSQSQSEKLRSGSPAEHPLNEKGLPLDDTRPVNT